VPFVNWALMISTIWLVLFFQSSSNMAAAYGVAVTATMTITTCLVFFVARDRWKFSPIGAFFLVLPFAVIDFAFLASSMTKLIHGGWFPLFIGILILTVMTTWRRGRTILADRLRSRTVPFDTFLANIKKQSPVRVPGTAIFMTSSTAGAPPALVHNVKHNKVLHETVALMTVTTAEVPYVPREERFKIEQLASGFYTIAVSYGFMDTPNVPAVLLRCDTPQLRLDLSEVTYFLGRETVLATSRPGMAIWRENLFSIMSRNAQRATAYFRIPPSQVVEIGIQIEL
jgi:KUP system potassium uptake protein